MQRSHVRTPIEEHRQDVRIQVQGGIAGFSPNSFRHVTILPARRHGREDGDFGLLPPPKWASPTFPSRGTSDANIRFDDLCRVLKRLGFAERVRGDHHIFTRDGVEEILNLQTRGSLAKAYQVKQVRNVIVQYKLAEEQDAE